MSSCKTRHCISVIIIVIIISFGWILAVGPHEDLLTIVKRRKLQWYGHVSHSLGLAKTILQGRVKGGRRQLRHCVVRKCQPS